MAKKTADSLLKPGTAETGEGHSGIKALTRRGYKRRPETERQIAEAAVLDAKPLLARAQHRDEAEPGYLAAETLVHFIRRADRNNDRKLRDDLFRELFERCKPFFRGQFRACDKTTREDLEQEVLKKVVEAILAPDDRADFLEVRFWTYMNHTSTHGKCLAVHWEMPALCDCRRDWASSLILFLECFIKQKGGVGFYKLTGLDAWRFRNQPADS